jgi:hypothetical protein
MKGKKRMPPEEKKPEQAVSDDNSHELIGQSNSELAAIRVMLAQLNATMLRIESQLTEGS